MGWTILWGAKQAGERTSSSSSSSPSSSSSSSSSPSPSSSSSSASSSSSFALYHSVYVPSESGSQMTDGWAWATRRLSGASWHSGEWCWASWGRGERCWIHTLVLNPKSGPRTRMLTRLLMEKGNNTCPFSTRHSCGTPWHDTLIWESGRTLLLDAIAQHSCETLLLDKIWHTYLAFWLDALVGHAYLTLL